MNTNDLLNSTLDLINDENRTIVLTFVKKVIIPAMVQEKMNTSKPEQKELKTPVQTTLELPTKSVSEKTDKELDPRIPKGSKNGHKIEKKRSLEDWEKDLMRQEFIALNGEIHEDACLEIKDKLSSKTAIFQVTGFISLLHKYVKKGEIELRDMESYYEFQRQKKSGVKKKKKTNIITIRRSNNA